MTVGGTQQFTATGTYSDESTQDLTTQVTWASSNTAAATINAAGSRPRRRPGATTISATLGAVSGSTGLTVQSPGRSRSPRRRCRGDGGHGLYARPCRRTGGLPPYTWSIVSGALPDGLTLTANSGVISGTPTSAGTSNFTVQVRPGARTTSPVPLSITVDCRRSTIWPSNPTPAIVDGGEDRGGGAGREVPLRRRGHVTGCASTRAPRNSGTHVGSLWSGTGTRLASATFTGETGSGWQQVNFATPVAIQANTIYVASYFARTVTTAATSTTSRPRESTRRRCTRSRPAFRVATASTPTVRASTFPTHQLSDAQLLGRRPLQRGAGADPDVDRGDARQADDHDGRDAAVHGHGHVLGQRARRI